MYTQHSVDDCSIVRRITFMPYMLRILQGSFCSLDSSRYLGYARFRLYDYGNTKHVQWQWPMYFDARWMFCRLKLINSGLNGLLRCT